MEAFLYIGIVAIFWMIFIAMAWRKWSRRHELPCPAWLSWMVEWDNPFARTHRARFIVEHLQVEPGMSVLDAGCGPGRLTLPLAREVGPQGRVVAMDVQEGMLSRTREKVQAENLNHVEFLNAGLGDGKLEPNRFDRAVLVAVLGEIPDQPKALKEIFDALLPGGILSIVETLFDPHYQRRCTVSRLAEEAGFTIKETHGNGIAFAMNVQKPPWPQNRELN